MSEKLARKKETRTTTVGNFNVPHVEIGEKQTTGADLISFMRKLWETNYKKPREGSPLPKNLLTVPATSIRPALLIRSKEARPTGEDWQYHRSGETYEVFEMPTNNLHMKQIVKVSLSKAPVVNVPQYRLNFATHKRERHAEKDIVQLEIGGRPEDYMKILDSDDSMRTHTFSKSSLPHDQIVADTLQKLETYLIG